MDTKIIRVLIVDDHPPFAEGLTKLLSEQADLRPVGMARNGEEALALSRELKPDVIVMDISMPRVNGIEATRRIKEASPGSAILMLSAYGYQAYVLSALEAGAAGYLLKNTPMRELVSAIRALGSGETVLDQALAAKVMRTIVRSRDSKAPGAMLTASVLELLTLGATGKSNRDIAAQLFISERTVQSHFTTVFTKLGVGSRMEAVIKAIKEGWLSTDEMS